MPKSQTPVFTGLAQRYTAAGTLVPIGAGHTVFTSALSVGTKRMRTGATGSATQATPGALTTAPAKVGIRVVDAICGDEAVTVQRADGTNEQHVPLPDIQEHPDFRGTYGSFLAPVANGAGTWLITPRHSPLWC